MSEESKLVRETIDLYDHANTTMEKEKYSKMTTTKIRSLLTLVNNIYNKVYANRDVTLGDNIIDELKYLKVKFVYEIARENDQDKIIEDFYEDSMLDLIIDDVIRTKSKAEFLHFARYFEALVAYFKFHHSNKGDE